MPSILIAEDEPFIAELYKDNLEAAGMSASIAKNGNEAIARLQKGKYDLLLLDLLMPTTDGFAVLEWLQAHEKHALPVIVLSNLSQKLNQGRCEKLGASDYIVKSDVEIDDVIAAVKKHLRKK